MPGNANCCIYGCSNTYSIAESQGRKISLHVFPKNPDRRHVWIRFAKRDDLGGSAWEPTKNSRICSDHFVGKANSDTANHPDDPGYAPSTYPNNPELNKPRMNPKAIIERSIRAKNLQEKRKASMNQTQPESSTSSRINNEVILNDNIDLSNDNDVNMIDDDGGDIPPKSGFSHQEVQTEESILNHKMPIISSTFVSHSIINGTVHELATQVFHEFAKVEPAAASEPARKIPVETRDQGVGNDANVPTFYGHKSIEEQQGEREKMLEHLTGVRPQIFDILREVLEKSGYRPRKYKIEDMLLMFLMKLKHASTFRLLASIFNMKLTTAATNFYNILHRLNECTQDQVYWPTREEIAETLPECFRGKFSNCRAIIDCFEVRCEKPGTIHQANAMYSQYKSSHTIKVLIAVTPNGSISFLSQAYGGRAADGLITNFSGFLSKLSPGDQVLADKGFPKIDIDKVITMIPPRKAKNQIQFSVDQLAEGEEISSLRIQVERVIQRCKTYKIISHTVPHSILPHIDKILHVCAVLVNLQSSIIRDKSPLNEEGYDDDDILNDELPTMEKLNEVRDLMDLDELEELEDFSEFISAKCFLSDEDTRVNDNKDNEKGGLKMFTMFN